MRFENHSFFEANPSKVRCRILGYQALIIVLFIVGLVLIDSDLWWMARISAEYGNGDQCDDINAMFGSNTTLYK